MSTGLASTIATGLRPVDVSTSVAQSNGAGIRHVVPLLVIPVTVRTSMITPFVSFFSLSSSTFCLFSLSSSVFSPVLSSLSSFFPLSVLSSLSQLSRLVVSCGSIVALTAVGSTCSGAGTDIGVAVVPSATFVVSGSCLVGLPVDAGAGVGAGAATSDSRVPGMIGSVHV
jgi:hypothetical protein